jgi:iron complex transport system permease protein
MLIRGSRRRLWFLVLGIALLVALKLAGIASILVGPSGQSPGAAFKALIDGMLGWFTGSPVPTDSLHTIVMDIRLPRVLLGALVGACLGLAGAIMQALFQNPMADPYIIGVSGGAGLGAVVAMSFGVSLELAGLSAVPLLAFGGALGVTLLVYALSQRGGRVQTATLLLTGVAIGSLVSSVTAFVMLSRDELAPGVLSWLLGSLSGRGWVHVWSLLPQFLVAGAGAMIMARPLNVLLLGDEAAGHLGLEVQRSKRWLLALASLLAAGAVAVSGVIGFVGLLVPHISRLVVGPDHRVLLPVSALSGALLVLLADIVARTALAPTELPIGIVTSLLGCPFFLYLLYAHGHREL